MKELRIPGREKRVARADWGAGFQKRLIDHGFDVDCQISVSYDPCWDEDVYRQEIGNNA